MPIQRPQHRRRVRTSAAHTSTGGNALGNANGEAIWVFFQSVTIDLGCFPCQIPLIGGNPLLGTFQSPWLSGSHINLYIIPDGDGLHNAFDVVVAVLPLAQHIQGQVQFCKCAFV